MSKRKLAVGFIAYGKSTAKYLPEFLPSLIASLQEAGLEYRLWAFDNMPSDKSNSDFIMEKFPDISIDSSGANIGFGKAYNRMITEAKNWGAEFFLVLNPDTYWGRETISHLLAAIELDDLVGSVAPKVYRWDFALDKTTKIIDSCGIVRLPGMHFIDLWQGEFDRGAFQAANIIGPSGCAGLYRMSALEDIKMGQEYFDELMFMYKEDCDLAMRLKLAGWSSEFVSEAHVWHDRTASGSGLGLAAIKRAFGKQSEQVRRWSFHNQLILCYKYRFTESPIGYLKIYWFLFLRLLYASVFARYLFKELKSFWSIRQRIHMPKK